jgi:hypothetical protein
MLVTHISKVIDSKGQLTYDFEDFIAMMDRLCMLFRKEIDDSLVAVMMQDSAVMAIKDKILGQKRKNTPS